MSKNKDTADNSEETPVKQKNFMTLKDEWKIDSISNSIFSIRKGEIIRIPTDMKIEESMFNTFFTYEDAIKFTRSQPVEITSNKLTTTETMNSRLRKVMYPNADGTPGKTGWILRDKDIPEELSQPVREILRDLMKIDDEETLAKMLEVEKRCDKRKAVIDEIEKKLKL